MYLQPSRRRPQRVPEKILDPLGPAPGRVIGTVFLYAPFFFFSAFKLHQAASNWELALKKDKFNFNFFLQTISSIKQGQQEISAKSKTHIWRGTKVGVDFISSKYNSVTNVTDRFFLSSQEDILPGKQAKHQPSPCGLSTRDTTLSSVLCPPASPLRPMCGSGPLRLSSAPILDNRRAVVP